MENRDVAQLVAHYVRDVGVGRSSRLIPTFDAKCRLVSWVKLLIFSTKHCVVSKVHANQEGQKWDSNVTVPLPFKKTLTSHTK